MEDVEVKVSGRELAKVKCPIDRECEDQLRVQALDAVQVGVARPTVYIAMTLQ